jgi:hypothetical protein
LARHIARAAFRASREIGDLMPFLKQHLPEHEYLHYAHAIATAVAAIQLELLNKLAADHPGVQAEIEASIAKYDRYL